MTALGGVNDKQIQAAELIIGAKFSDEFKAYVKTYGAISALGLELLGVSEHDRLDSANATIKARNKDYAINSNMYVVNDLQIDGILILQNQKGEIFEIAPHLKPKKIFDSLKDYLLNDYID